MRRSKTLIPFFLAILLQPVSSTCYYPNGTADDNYQPCNRVQGVNGMCCALDRPNLPSGPDSKGYTADICLENGLCQNIVQRTSTGQMVYTYWRTLCTSADWSTNGCLNVCTQGGVYLGHTVPLTPCENTPESRTWCCGQNNTACCGTSEAIMLAPTMAVGLLASTASSTSVSTVSSSGAASATTEASIPSTSTPASASQPRSSSLSTGATVGIGIGVGVGSVAVFGALAVLLIRWRRRVASTRSYPFSGVGIVSRSQLQEKPADGPLTRHELSARNLVEAEGESPVVGWGRKPGAFTT